MAEYDETYSFTIQSECNDEWILASNRQADHEAQNADNANGGYWCWTNTSSPSSGTGPPTGVACIYSETSSPSTVGDEFTCELRTALNGWQIGFNVEFNTCMYGNTAGHAYFEAWDGDSWNIIDDWAGDATTTFTSRGPYDLTTYTNTDFKIRFRVVTGGTSYQNDFSWDEVRIYGDYRTTYTISGITRDKNGNVLGSCEVTLFKSDTATPPVYTYIDNTTSNAVTGAYSFTVYDQDARYMVYSIKDDIPHVFDATDNELQGT